MGGERVAGWEGVLNCVETGKGDEVGRGNMVKARRGMWSRPLTRWLRSIQLMMRQDPT